jgi:hypothetical protein
MSIRQLTSEIASLNKDIANLQEKYAKEKKLESDKKLKIISIQKTITKSTSASMLTAKQKQIAQLENEIAQSTKKQANLSKEIASKQKKHSDRSASLIKEQEKDAKEKSVSQDNVLKSYELKIKSLQQQMDKFQINDITESVKNNIYGQDNSINYDVFISHASEDKESFVNDLVEELTKLGVKVWYDKLCIIWGDSLRSKIDEGLRNSKYGIVILSEAYIKKGWTQYELEGLFNIEMTNGKTILPIWHNITKRQVQEFSPTIAGRLAINTTMQTADEIALELVSLLNIQKNNI